MKLSKPDFWKNKNSILAILLLPISIIIQIMYLIKNILVSKKIFQVPVICVGNIYVGGTGKTPLSIRIFNGLKKTNKNPIIIKKF